jgi:hypothetical protein
MFQDIEKPPSLIEVARSNREGMNFAIARDTTVAILVHLILSAYIRVQTHIEKVSL